MRRRQMYAQQNEMRPAALPGTGAEAGQGFPSASAPRPITYQHDERTTVTLPISDFTPGSVRLGDEVARMGALDKAIAMIQANNPDGPLHIDLNPVDPKRAKKLASLEKARAARAAKRARQ